MRKVSKPAMAIETLRKQWEMRIMSERGYSPECAELLSKSICMLVSYMYHGNALVAFRKQDGSFQLVKATLRHYRSGFHKEHDMLAIKSCIVYWDIDRDSWSSFQLENLLDWRAAD